MASIWLLGVSSEAFISIFYITVLIATISIFQITVIALIKLKVLAITTDL
jgi:hypothetical protein